MLKRKTLPTIVMMISLVILLLLGLYFAHKSWKVYQENKTIQQTLNSASYLEKYEVAVFNEILCNELVSGQTNKKVKDICKENTAISNHLAEIQNDDDNLKHWIQKVQILKENINKKEIANLETFLGQQSIHSIAYEFMKNAQEKKVPQKLKNLLSVYMQLLNIHYTTEIESFLVTYYVTKQIPVTTFNMIYWDKIANASSLSGIQIENLGKTGETLGGILGSKSLYKILSKIDDMRIAILTSGMDKRVQHFDWIELLDKKLKTLDTMKKSVKHAVMDISMKNKESALRELSIFLLISILALLSLINLFVQIKNERKENAVLVETLNKIAALSPDIGNKSEAMHKMINNMETKKDLYEYIFHSFEHVNEKVKEAQDEAKSKSDFLATLSHEIRTPLNGITGFTKLLRDMGTTPDQEEFLSLIEGSSNHLIMVINDILELSKINAEKMEIENVSFDIFKTIESIVSVFTYQTDQKDIELALFIDPFLKDYFLGDATKISQILTNLIGNAVKFTNPYGKINIFVQSLHHNETEATIKFAVSDDGVGLSEEQKEKIFNPYTQATQETSHNFGGTGLGLTISKKMVELMGGELEVESQPNKGTTFFFTLTLQNDKTKVFEPYPHFENVMVGLALPVRSIKRQLDTNLEIYLRHLGAKFKLYYYDELFENDVWVDLPDIMIFDHHYARLPGELEQCQSIECQSVLLTNSTLHTRVHPEKHRFTDVIYTPITIHKAIRILNDISLKSPIVQKEVKKLQNADTFDGLNALVADDNMINRKLIKIILEKLGINVHLSENGEEVFEKYKDGDYDIVFMDIQMPVVDGVEATKRILAYEKEHALPHTPIIALTANVAMGDKEKYLSEGMDDYATKPLDVETLKRMILKHCKIELSSEDKEK